jgi:uncharacterized protein DUF4157
MKTTAGAQKTEAPAQPEKAPSRPVPPVQRVQRAVGNFGMQRAVQAKLHVGSADDPLEREADAVAGQVTSGKGPCSCSEGGGACEECSSAKPQVSRAAERSARGAHNVPASVIASLAGGRGLDAGTRAIMQKHFGVDFGGVRVHTGEADATRARSIGARAFTYGSDIVFNRGQYRPETPEGMRLLAHELTHVMQKAGAADGERIHANGDGDGGTPPSPPPATPPAPATDPAAPAVPATLPSAQTPEVPRERLRAIPRGDLLVGVTGRQLVAMPVQGQAWTIAPAPESGSVPEPSPPTPVLTIPTVGKEGLVAVNAGGNTAFLIDAGGLPLIVSPDALTAIRGALGVTSIRGVVITHVHRDHIRSLATIVRTAEIRPENVFFPEAFEPMLRPILNGLRADPALAPLGYSPTATFSTFATPAAGTFFHEQRVEGDMIFDYYGLTGPMRTLQAAGRTNAVGTVADTASLLTRVTHRPSGMGVLYVGDLRGGDLTQFREAMGDPLYDQVLRGVRVIQGLQHHLGALDDPTTPSGRADRAGLTDLLVRTTMQGDPVTVMAQSGQRYRGLQFLNRSLIAGLNAMGIDVEVAREGAPGSVGTVTINTAGAVTRAGGGTMESFPGAATARAEFARLTQLRQVEEVLARYGRHVDSWGPNPSLTVNDVRTARQALEAELTSFITSTIGNVGSGATARENFALSNPTAQQEALERLQGTARPITNQFQPTYLEALRQLNRLGPHLETYEREIRAARTTGRLSDAGIDALWEINPEMAQRLVRNSNLSRAEQRRVAQQLPGGPAPVGRGVVAGVLLAIEVANIVAPLVQQEQARAFNADVATGMNDIMWWQDKGVFPSLHAVYDGWTDNVQTTDPATINRWIGNNEISYLTITGIDASYWTSFMIWASANIRNFRDWEHHIMSSAAISGSGEHVDDKSWSYRRGTISESTFGFSLNRTYVQSPDLTRILNGVATAMAARTEEQLGERATGPGGGMQPEIGPPGFTSQAPLHNLPQATGRRRFRAGVTPRLFTVRGQREISGYSAESVFYVFPSSASMTDPVPAGYVVVSGANYNTYQAVYLSPNRATSTGLNAQGQPYDYNRRLEVNTLEILLARESDLEPVP